MINKALCPNCKEALEPESVYCGNCGYQLRTPPITQDNDLPAYDIPVTHHKQHWLAMALALGILGICAGLLIPILGIALGVVGLILVTTSYHLGHGWLKPAGLIVSALAILLSLGIWVKAIDRSNKTTSTLHQAGTANGIATLSVNTPCYSLTFNSILNVNNASGSCTINAYNGLTLASSSNLYKVLASYTSVNNSSFAISAKSALEQDVAKNLPAFSITSEQPSLFEGSSAYFVQAYNSANNVAVIEEAVLHNSKAKNNFFVIVHADLGRLANLDSIAGGWQWSDQ